MHYCCVMLTREFPSDAVIEKLLEPFNDKNVYGDGDDDDAEIVYPAFTWDWWQVGGRYSGKFKLRYDSEDEDSKYRWRYYADQPRTKRLFRSWALEEIMEITNETRRRLLGFTEEDYFTAMGSRDGFLYVDGALIADLINFDDKALECFCFVDADGNGYVRRYYDGVTFTDIPDFDATVKAICEAQKDCYVVTVDLHD